MRITLAGDVDVLERIGTALADPTRRRILTRLLVGPAYPAELAEVLDVSRAKASNHLACLEPCPCPPPPLPPSAQARPCERPPCAGGGCSTASPSAGTPSRASSRWRPESRPGRSAWSASAWTP